MALSIKNDVVEQLARELAELTRETITDSIKHALEERLTRLKGRRVSQDTAQEMMEISQRCAALPDLDPRSPEEILGYDEDGALPW